MANPNLTATISCNGSIYNAWESVTVRRDYGNAISVFSFTPAENAYGPNYQDLRLQTGDPVTITLAGQLALTGNICERSVAYDASSHQVVIAGRSATAAAYDSSVKVTQGNYNGYTFEQAAKAVLKPFNINLTLDNPGDAASKPFETCNVQFGEKAAEFISRLAMQRGLYLTDDVKGGLVASQLNSKSSVAATFREGENILRASMKQDNQGVCGQYQGVSQAPGNDQNWPSRAYSATATNTSGPANVLSLFISEHPGNADDLVARVRHETDVSLLKVFTVSVTVIGWLSPSGQLWDPQMQASVYSPMLFSNSQSVITFGIQSVTFSQDNANGSTTTIDMTLPNLLSETAHNGAAAAGDAPSTFANPQDPKPDQPDTSVST